MGLYFQQSLIARGQEGRDDGRIGARVVGADYVMGVGLASTIEVEVRQKEEIGEKERMEIIT